MSKVIIIGAGPSALYAAKTILENSRVLTVEIFEQGKKPSERFCVADYKECERCTHCTTLEGVGGAGLFSDGKLVLDLTSGGVANGIAKLSDYERQLLEEQIRNTFLEFDGVSEYKEKPSLEIQEKINSLYKERNLEFKFYNVLHMGTKNLNKITNNFVQYLYECYNERFKLYTETVVNDITIDELGYRIYTSNGNSYYAKNIIFAVGKSGALWQKEMLSKLGCTFKSHDFFFGFRMETSADNMENLTKYSFDPKISRVLENRKIKVHCFCRKGKIRYSRYHDTIVVGGHSPTTEKTKNEKIDSSNANFNILLSFDPKKFSAINMLNQFKKIGGEKTVVQKLSDFKNNEATVNYGSIVPENLSMVKCGNLRDVMDSIDPEFSKIALQFIDSISKLQTGVINDDDNLLYAPAIEWDMDSVIVNQYMETERNNIFAIGDGAGLSQGIVYSSATGILAAREIVARFEGGVK